MMADPNTLEMLGKLLVQTARNQRMSQDWFGWLAGSRGAPPDAAKALQQFAQLPALPTPAELSSWRDQLLLAVRDWMSLFDLVPAADHRRLKARCADLETECRQKEETIRSLTALVGAGGQQQEAYAATLQTALSEQGRLMQKALNLFWHAGQDRAGPDEPQ
jgi:hypothetical protein